MEARLSSQLRDMQEESERNMQSQREVFERQLKLCQGQFMEQICKQAKETEEKTEKQICSLRDAMARLNSVIANKRALKDTNKNSLLSCENQKSEINGF